MPMTLEDVSPEDKEASLVKELADVTLPISVDSDVGEASGVDKVKVAEYEEEPGVEAVVESVMVTMELLL